MRTTNPSANRFSALVILFMMTLFTSGCNQNPGRDSKRSMGDSIPEELVRFIPYEKNPVFTGTNINTWDEKIRERGFILKEPDGYHMWYTGYREATGDEIKLLGYATSPDGISWTRHPANPVFTESWVEDMIVLKRDSMYYMFAEGRDDIAHMLTSVDKVRWTDHGSLDIRQTNGEPLTPGPYGTPTVFVEDNVWHLFYERNDLGIWHATSSDLKRWKNVQDEPVITMGPEKYDQYGVAMNQIVQYGDRYYAYYHGTPTEDWSLWNTNVAVSRDLNTWTKFNNNPIVEQNKSSGILVHDGTRLRLYTMHDRVDLHFSDTILSRRN